MPDRLVSCVQDFLDAEVHALEENHAGTGKPKSVECFNACRQQLEQYLDRSDLLPQERPLADKAWSYLEALDHFESTDKHQEGAVGAAASMLSEAQRDLEGMVYQYVRYGAGDGEDHRKRILVAVDDQAHSDWALKTAIELAQSLPGRLMLLHVVPSATANPCDSGRYDATRAEFFRERANTLLEQKREAVPSGICSSTLVHEGNAAFEIVKVARRWGADYIVMGTRGRGRIARFILGSVAEGVLRRSPCPVVAVGHGPWLASNEMPNPVSASMHPRRTSR